jgi:hypothetical protein
MLVVTGVLSNKMALEVIKDKLVDVLKIIYVCVCREEVC